MYGYVKQPDGVLKPILLKGIKNLIVSGNSLNIIYFQSAGTPIEVLKVDQVTYQQNGDINVCNNTPVNGKYILTGGNLINGDIKISFNSSTANILSIFTKWMNSVLSGKVHATTDKTLNEFAPNLEIGYVFGNMGTIPTALAMPIPEGQTPCSTPAISSESKVVYVAWDLQADPTPPVHTQLFEILFDDATGTVNFTPLNSGQYKLYQFIAPVPNPDVEPGPGAPPDCAFLNALADTIPEDVEYSINVVAGGITSISLCEVSIQASFRTWDTDLDIPIQTKAFDATCGGENIVCPTVGPPNMPGVERQTWEYFINQQSSGLGSNPTSVNGFFCSNGDPSCGPIVVNEEIANGPDMPYVPGAPGKDLNSPWRINPNYGNVGYPQKAVAPAGALEVFEYPEIGIQGVGMGVFNMPASPEVLPSIGKKSEQFYICNGIPVTLDNKWRLDPTVQSKLKSLMYTEGSQSAGLAAPPFWVRNDNDATLAPPPTLMNDGVFEEDFTYVTDKGINFRPVLSLAGADWTNILPFNMLNEMRELGMLPGNNPPPQEPGPGQILFGPTELMGNIRLWWRTFIPPKQQYSNEGGYTIFNPNVDSSTGLPPNMTKNTFESGPFGMQSVYPSRVMLTPFIVEETYQPFIDAGFTHRAFNVGTAGAWGIGGFGNMPHGYDTNKKFISGVQLRQLSQGDNMAFGDNLGVVNNWFTDSNINATDGAGQS
tara:strand:+ start:906 stop:3041 length:2136 start_codon:yes stop_codon:yes gene_type:complete